MFLLKFIIADTTEKAIPISAENKKEPAERYGCFVFGAGEKRLFIARKKDILKQGKLYGNSGNERHGHSRNVCEFFWGFSLLSAVSALLLELL